MLDNLRAAVARATVRSAGKMAVEHFRLALKQFGASFRIPARFFLVLLLDLLYGLFVYGIFTLYSSLLQIKVLAVTGGQGLGQVQQLLTSGSAEQLGLIATSLQELAFLLIGGSVLFVVLVFFGFVLCQAVIWHVILHAHLIPSSRSPPRTRLPWKPFWRWSGLVLLSFLISFCLGAGFAVLQLIIKSIIGINAVASTLIFVLTSLFVVLFLLFFFIVCAYFSHDSHVLLSFGRVFRLIFGWRLDFLFLLLFSFVVFAVLQLIQIPLQNQFFVYPALGIYVPLGLFVVYLGWLRGYVAGVITPSA